MPRHVVVDGSNIATEGRAMPSLKQLNEAVLAYMEEHPEDLITVVVDATFGHRIDPREVPEFDAAVENNELVSPPAGAIGRGDAFVLTIANKANAVILSNDSFQEFHGDYPWLFDGDRLLGGKPVPHVGWVFVPRAPVRGPVSRRAVREKDHGRASVSSRTHGRPSKAASEPMPVPKTPPPGSRRRRSAGTEAATPDEAAAAAGATPGPSRVDGSGKATAVVRHATVNELLPFLNFVEAHPIGTTVEGAAESYSSHGAYVTIGDVRAYVPLRYLADPPPRSARDVLSLGDTSQFVVVSFNPPRRSIDLARPGLQPAGLVMAPAAVVISPGAEAELTVSEPIERPPKPAPAPAEKAAKKTAKRARKSASAKAAEPTAAEVAAAEVATTVDKAAAPGLATGAESVLVEAEPAPTPVRTAAKRARKAAPVAAVEPAEAEPVKKAAKRTRKSATKVAPVEPPPAEPEPVKTPVKKAAKRTRKAAPPDVTPEARAPAPAAKKSRARSRPTPAAEAG
jgi:hypothetical protein